MKAKDLRLGNWIVDDENNLCKITGLRPFDHSVRCDEMEGCLILIDIYKPNIEVSKGFECDSNEINSIELTEEWLLKFGFNKKSNGYIILTEMKEALLVSFGNHNVSINGIAFNHSIKHVHQLQNLYFALTGEELTLKK